MKKCRVCLKAKALDQFHADKCKKDGHGSICKSCASLRAKGYYSENEDVIKARSSMRYKNNPELIAAQMKEWVRSNREKSRAIKKKWQDSNKAKVAVKNKRWAQLNADRVAKTRAAWKANNTEHIALKNAEWNRNNPGKKMAHKATRRAREIHATPSWANTFFIEEIYDLAAQRNKITGRKWQVDHIVPLVSRKVCGLHVENNLQVVTAFINQSKNNRYWPDMPEEKRA